MRSLISSILTWVLVMLPLCFCSAAHAVPEPEQAAHACCSTEEVPMQSDDCSHCEGMIHLDAPIISEKLTLENSIVQDPVGAADLPLFIFPVINHDASVSCLNYPPGNPKAGYLQNQILRI